MPVKRGVSGRYALPALLLAAACSPGSPASTPKCTAGFLGDESSPPQLDILVLQAGDSIATVDDGGAVPMILPPQGGRVIFVGVQATNIDGCGLQLTGALRNETSQQVRFDSRTVDLIATDGGWGASGIGAVSTAISNFANVPVCPNEWSTTNVFGNSYGLEVTILDREKRQLTKKIRVTPECGEPANVVECMCICKAGYVLGEACGADDAGDGA